MLFRGVLMSWRDMRSTSSRSRAFSSSVRLRSSALRAEASRRAITTAGESMNTAKPIGANFLSGRGASISSRSSAIATSTASMPASSTRASPGARRCARSMASAM